MNWKPIFYGGLLWAAALLIALTVSGCSTSGSVTPRRDLPAVPAFAQAVSVPDPKAGESALTVAARERAGRLANGRTITAFRDWYSGVRRAYASKD